MMNPGIRVARAHCLSAIPFSGVTGIQRSIPIGWFPGRFHQLLMLPHLKKAAARAGSELCLAVKKQLTISPLPV